jgi:hypothetical protein
MDDAHGSRSRRLVLDITEQKIPPKKIRPAKPTVTHNDTP